MVPPSPWMNQFGRPFIIRRAVCSFATRKDWQTERRYGGGYLLNWGAHIIDPPVLLVDGKVESVYGRLRQTINPGDGEDLFMALQPGTFLFHKTAIDVISKRFGLPHPFSLSHSGIHRLRHARLKRE